MNFEYPEGATPLDPDEADGLLLTHVTTRGELDRWEQENIIDALSWADKAKPNDILNEQFVEELHRRMFAKVWRWAGRFRRSDKNIGVPWQQIATTLKRLCDDTKLWIDLGEESADMIAARFHHRLVSIHPFPNGNGRHARLMADLLLENVLLGSRFSWGGKNLSEQGSARQIYISALKAADGGDFGPLLAFVRS